VAEHSLRSTREHRRYPAAPLAEPRVTNGMDASMNTVESASAHPTGDAVAVNPGHTQLGEGDHPALTRGDLGKPGLGSGGFLSHFDQESAGKPAGAP
jgi:hypothetical protein